MTERARYNLLLLCMFLVGSFTASISLNGCSQRELFTDPADKTNGGDQSGSGNDILIGSIQGDLLYKYSPYRAIGKITIDSLQTLNIEAGVMIIFSDSASLIIKGKINCLGSVYNPVIFTSEENRTWKGMIVSNSSGENLIQYAVFENIDVYSQPKDSLRMGAIEITNSRGTIRNTVFRNNRSKNGGALYLESSGFNITNSIFTGNFASVFGGAVISINSSNRIINNTFTDNEGFNYGGGIVLIDPGTEDIQNNIFYKNKSRTGDPSIAVKNSRPGQSSYQLKYNYTELVNSDPLFISAADLRLKTGSPCINAGNPASEFNDPDGSRNDQGAYGGPLGNW